MKRKKLKRLTEWERKQKKRERNKASSVSTVFQKKKSHIYQRKKEKWLVGMYRYTGYRFPGPRCATPTTRGIYSC